MSEYNNTVMNNAEFSADNNKTYAKIRISVITAQNKIYNAVHSAMVQAY